MKARLPKGMGGGPQNMQAMLKQAQKMQENIEAKKDYIGEFLFKKIEQHPIAHEKNFTIDIIGRITGMILGIDDIKEIYEITTNYENLTARINEALSLIEGQTE